MFGSSISKVCAKVFNNAVVKHIHSSSAVSNKFLGGFFERKVEQQQSSHSDQLGKKERIIEIQTHSVKPDAVDKYLKNQEAYQGKLFVHRKSSLLQNFFIFTGFVNANKDVLHGSCLGNFSVLVGDQDQFVHIWEYEGGYQNIDENLRFLSTNTDHKLITGDMKPLLRNRETEFFLPFSFWPKLELR